MLAIAIKNLKKKYKDTFALKGVDLEIPQGEFFGLLGPNGAGKTTLISCVVGLAHASEGGVEVFGQSVKDNPLAAKMHIGFSPQEVNVDRFFNLQKTLEFQGGFFGLSYRESRSRATELLGQFGLSAKSKQPFYKLSGGMQKRLLVARALISRPKLLILDEPTAGVDVEQRHELWKYLRNLNQDGTTIILTTHYIDEAEALCERVGIIAEGKILELGSPLALIEKYCEAQLCIEVDEALRPEDFLEIVQAKIEGRKIRVSSTRLGPLLEKIIHKILAQPQQHIRDIHLQRGSLEEVFLKVTGKRLQAPMPPAA